MSNMGYCRFQNTAQDVADCVRHLNDSGLSAEEKAARLDLVEFAKQIVDECYTEDGDPIPFKDDDEESEDDAES